MRHDIQLCDQSGEDQDKAWLNGPVAMVKGKYGLDHIIHDGVGALVASTLGGWS